MDKSILQKAYELIPGDADFKCSVKPSSLIKYYIRAAWQHAEQLGIGYTHLNKEQLAWVLWQFELNWHGDFKWPGEFTLKTWPKGCKRLIYERDAIFIDSNGNKIATLSSDWLIVNQKSKRPTRLNNEIPELDQNKERNALIRSEPSNHSKINQESYNFKVLYSDIDMNQHLTTSRYIDYIFDTFSLDFLAQNELKSIWVKFEKEILFNENLTMNRYANNSDYYFELLNENQICCFKATIRYK